MICQKWCKLIKKYKKSSEADDGCVKSLLVQCETYYQRIKELEDAINTKFGVTVRKDITEIKIDFSKMELTVLYAALCKIMEQKLNTEDLKYYLNLRIKIEELLNQMKEE
jgi:hypothetical protein